MSGMSTALLVLVTLLYAQGARAENLCSMLLLTPGSAGFEYAQKKIIAEFGALVADHERFKNEKASQFVIRSLGLEITRLRTSLTASGVSEELLLNAELQARGAQDSALQAAKAEAESKRKILEAKQKKFLSLKFIEHDAELLDLRACASGEFVLSASKDSTAKLSNVYTGEAFVLRSGAKGDLSGTLSPDNNYVLTVLTGEPKTNHGVQVNATATGAKLIDFELPGFVLNASFVTPSDGRTLVFAAGSDQNGVGFTKATVVLHDVGTGKKIFEDNSSNMALQSAGVSERGRYAFWAGDTLSVLDLKTMQKTDLLPVAASKNEPHSAFAAISPDESLAYAVMTDNTVKLFELNTGAFSSHKLPFTGTAAIASFSSVFVNAPAQRVVVLNEQSANAYYADYASGVTLTIPLPSSGVDVFYLGTENFLLVTAGEVSVYGVGPKKTPKKTKSILKPDKYANLEKGIVSNTRQYLTVHETPDNVHVLDLSGEKFNPKTSFSLLNMKGGVSAVIFSADDRYLAVVPERGAWVRVYDLLSRRQAQLDIKNVSHTNAVAAFSGDGAYLVLSAGERNGGDGVKTVIKNMKDLDWQDWKPGKLAAR